MSQANNGSRAAPEYLQDPGDLSREDVDRIQKAEIERIIREPLEKVLGDNFFLHSSEERGVAFVALSKYVHPDKQPPDRQARATEAQQSKCETVRSTDEAHMYRVATGKRFWHHTNF